MPLFHHCPWQRLCLRQVLWALAAMPPHAPVVLRTLPGSLFLMVTSTLGGDQEPPSTEEDPEE